MDEGFKRYLIALSSGTVTKQHPLSTIRGVVNNLQHLGLNLYVNKTHVNIFYKEIFRDSFGTIPPRNVKKNKY